MESPVGTIVSIVAGAATVQVDRAAACARCAAGKGCGAGLLGGSSRPAYFRVPLPPNTRIREGDRVQLTLAPSELLRATMFVYGLPLAGIVLMLVAGWLVMSPLSDAQGIALAVTGLAAGLLAGRWRLHRRDCLKQFVPKIESIADVAR